LQEQLTAVRQEHELVRSTLAGAAESKRLLKFELERARQAQQEIETLHLQAVRQAEYLRGELEANARGSQTLELALQYCRQALQACQYPPSPASEPVATVEQGK